MTEYVLLSDVHGNADALESVIEREGEDSNYLILGDLMGLMAQPSRVVSIIRSLENTQVLAGNHDHSIFHEDRGHVNSSELSRFEYDHTMDTLSEEQIAWVRQLSYFDVIERDGQRICLTHAMPWPDQASGYESGNAGIKKRDLPHIASAVSDDYDWVFHGHTHTQYELDAEPWTHDVHFVNPGSLGYQGYYATVDTESGEVELKSVEIDDSSLKEHISSVLPEYAPSVEKWY